MKLGFSLSTLTFFTASVVATQAAVVWQAGAPGRGWPLDGVGGGPDIDFVQEGAVEPPPGNANGVDVPTADDDYYFAGVYGIGTVTTDEIAGERAFAGLDNALRYRHNMIGVNPTDMMTISFEANNLHIDAATVSDPRYGIELRVNGNLVMSEMIIRPAQLGTVITSPAFSAASVGINPSAGFDNVVELTGINYSADGGGAWMGIDYVQLDANPIPEPSSGLLGLLAGGALLLLRRSRD